MFGGIVETIGKISFLQPIEDCLEIRITPNTLFSDLKIGDSVSVNGICLTVTKIIANEFTVTAVPETLRLTNFHTLQLENWVNLERALAVNSRIGGHNVQGHIDFCGEILSRILDGERALLIKISYPPAYGKYLINKGYVALDGMSITIIKVEDAGFSVTIIPHTQEVTIVKDYRVGSKINVEVDIMGKYVEKIIGAYSK